MENAVKTFLKRAAPARLRPGLKIIYRIYKRIFFFGFRHVCPICNARLRTFLPYGRDFPVLREKSVVGGGYRLNSLCPICGCTDRERLLYLYLLHKTDVFRNAQKLLHIAPEERTAALLQSKTHLDYLTADLQSQNVMVIMDITNIPYPDSSFDAIICNHVLEHIIDDRKAMSELHRILKPRGWAILQVPLSLSLDSTFENCSITTPQGREEAFGQEDHVRIYARDYNDRLAQAGFKVNCFQWPEENMNFGGSRNLYGLNKDEWVFLGTRGPSSPASHHDSSAAGGNAGKSM